MDSTAGIPIRIGDRIEFELEDLLHDSSIRRVSAQVVRKYPSQAYGLAFDCIDLDFPDIGYTVPYEENFIKINSG